MQDQLLNTVSLHERHFTSELQPIHQSIKTRIMKTHPSIKDIRLRMSVSYAMTITKPVKVTVENYEKLSLYAQNGPSVYPGINSILRTVKDTVTNTNKCVSIDKNELLNANYVLELGDIVECHLQTFDTVLIRDKWILEQIPKTDPLYEQTYSDYNIRDMSYYLIEVDTDLSQQNYMYLQIVLNIKDNDPYNVDFDGDELNIMVPQSVETVTELEALL